jgi:acyl-CoA reductase-like NAD-dependent aldehyde dehydrogenase
MTGETSCTEAEARHNIADAVEVIVETAALATIQSLEGSIPFTAVDDCLPLIFTEPLGVIFGIAPWNAPLILAVRACVGPLIAGNTVVLKVFITSPNLHDP